MDFNFAEHLKHFDYTHPEKSVPGLKWSESGECDLSWFDGTPPNHCVADPEIILCRGCGWKTENQMCGYDPRIKVLRTRQNQGLWRIGSDWLLRDTPNDYTMGNDVATQEYIRSLPDLKIPLIKDMIRLNDAKDPIQMTLMRRVDGEPLNIVWERLSDEEKRGYANELLGYVEQWRKITSPVIETVDHKQPEDTVIGLCGIARCKTIPNTEDEWIESLASELKKGLAIVHKTDSPSEIERLFQKLKAGFPKGYPFVLTHGDLDTSNILVKDGKIVAIIDWEWAAFLPSWVEKLQLYRANSNASLEFTQLLSDDPRMGFDQETWQAEMSQKLGPVLTAWNACKPKLLHPDRFQGWWTPPFCKCRPFNGRFTAKEMGRRFKHSIGD
jgi:hypothetical protein